MADSFVALGDSNLVLDTSFGIQLIDVQNVVVHPSFKNEEEENEHDIGGFYSSYVSLLIFTCF